MSTIEKPDSDRRSYERLAQLQRITATLNAVASTDAVGAGGLPLICEAIGAVKGSIWAVSADGRELELIGLFGVPDDQRPMQRIPLESSVLLGGALRNREPVFIESRELYEITHRQLAVRLPAPAAGTWVVIPFVIQERELGGIGLELSGWRTVAPEERTFLLAAAGQCAQALDRARLYDAERRSREEAQAAEARRKAIQIKNDELLRENAQARLTAEKQAARSQLLAEASSVFASAAIDLERVLETVVRHISDVIGEGVSVRILSTDGKLNEHGATWHPDADVRAAALHPAMTASRPADVGLFGQVLRTGERLIIPNVDLAAVVEQYRALGLTAQVEKVAPKTLVLLPLRAGLRQIGVLVASRSREERPYDVEEVNLLEELANRAAIAIDNARLHAETRQTVVTLNDSLALLDALFVAAPIGMAVIDEEQRYVRVNRFLAEWNGVSIERSIGRTVREVLREPLASFVVPRVEACFRSGEPIHPEEIAIPSTGDPKTLQYWLQSFYPVKVGGVTRLVGSIRVDVSALRAANADREALIEDLARTLRFSEMFVGVLSHDLRNPLSAILAAAGLLLSRSDDVEKLQTPITRIVNSAERMRRMIDQLLDVTRIRMGKGVPLERERVDLAALCRELIDDLVSAGSDDIRLEARGNTAGQWDKDRIARMIANLVSNASQHRAPNSEVLVRVDGRSAEAVILRVHNRGAIDPDLLPVLFDPYRRTGKTHPSSGSSGLGLGLYISQQIAGAHAGSIEVESNERSGTAFTVILPREASPPGSPDGESWPMIGERSGPP